MVYTLFSMEVFPTLLFSWDSTDIPVNLSWLC